MSSPLFLPKNQLLIENSLLEFVNSQSEYLSPKSLNNPRTVGDAIPDLIADNIGKIFNNSSYTFQTKFTRRSMADLIIQDDLGFNYLIDIKTHNMDTKFNMPNLTSVERLAKLYREGDSYKSNYFVLMIFSYTINQSDLMVQKVHFVPIENMHWDCLTLGALGKGQIQIKKAKNIHVDMSLTRKVWMLELCDRLSKFYPNEINKIQDRIKYFEETMRFWESQ